MKYPINVVPLHDCVPLVVDSSQKKYSFISLCLKPEMWHKVAKFKGAEYFRKALYNHTVCKRWGNEVSEASVRCGDGHILHLQSVE